MINPMGFNQAGMNPGAGGSGKELYQRWFIFLRGQRTILENQKAQIRDLKGSLNGPMDLKALEYLVALINSLLAADLRNVFRVTSKVIHGLQSMFPTQLSLPIQKISTTLLTACISFTRLSSSVFAEGTKYEIKDTESSIPEAAIQDPECADTLVCRICDERVKSHMFAEHIQSCCIAHQSESQLQAINEKIKEINSIIHQTFLNLQWPGENPDDVIVNCLPMLHLCFLLDRALEIDARQPESKDIIAYIDSVIIIRERNKQTQFYIEAKRIVKEKLKRAIAIYSAKSVLQATRISGSTSITADRTTIADFSFIKIVSAGAYARVFLARKNATGDIYAIKVTPKNTLTQKNQVNRIIAEKDILLRFNHQNLVDFCMYFCGSS